MDYSFWQEYSFLKYFVGGTFFSLEVFIGGMQNYPHVFREDINK